MCPAGLSWQRGFSAGVTALARHFACLKSWVSEPAQQQLNSMGARNVASSDLFKALPSTKGCRPAPKPFMLILPKRRGTAAVAEAHWSAQGPLGPACQQHIRTLQRW
jgi:hypothetical protein